MENIETIDKSNPSKKINLKYYIEGLQSQYLGIENNLQGSRHRNLMKVYFCFNPEQRKIIYSLWDFIFYDLFLDKHFLRITGRGSNSWESRISYTCRAVE